MSEKKVIKISTINHLLFFFITFFGTLIEILLFQLFIRSIYYSTEWSEGEEGMTPSVYATGRSKQYRLINLDCFSN